MFIKENSQNTLKTKVSTFGVGLHSGSHVSMNFIPAPANTGVVFKRTDIKDAAKSIVRANYDQVSDTRLCTTISNEFGVKISTIEHVMAALWGVSIDNVIIEIDNEEVPIMDGSSEHFVFLLECAGVESLHCPRRVLEILKPIHVQSGTSCISVKPSDEFKISMEIDFDNKVISKQKYDCTAQDLSFKLDISRARTFGFAHEIEALQKMGLARGGSLENAIVVGEEGILNEGGLRYDDEFIRHKVLDCIGDFYLAGAYIKGHFEGLRPGHAINNKLLRSVFADPTAWRMVDAPLMVAAA